MGSRVNFRKDFMKHSLKGEPLRVRKNSVDDRGGKWVPRVEMKS